jgi:hypothetical protein
VLSSNADRPSPSHTQAVRSQVPAHNLKQVIVAAVRMRCVNEGCTAEFPVERLEAHLKEDCAHRRYVVMRGLLMAMTSRPQSSSRDANARRSISFVPCTTMGIAAV